MLISPRNNHMFTWLSPWYPQPFNGRFSGLFISIPQSQHAGEVSSIWPFGHKELSPGDWSKGTWKRWVRPITSCRKHLTQQQPIPAVSTLDQTCLGGLNPPYHLPKHGVLQPPQRPQILPGGGGGDSLGPCTQTLVLKGATPTEYRS